MYDEKTKRSLLVELNEVQLARYLTCTSLRTNSTKSSNYYQRFNTHGEYRLNAVSRSSLTVIHIYQSRDSADYITLVDPGHGLSSQTTIPSALRHHPCDQVTPTPRRPRLYQTRCSWPISYFRLIIIIMSGLIRSIPIITATSFLRRFYSRQGWKIGGKPIGFFFGGGSFS